MPHHRLLLPLAFIAFISLGMPDSLLGVAWPFLQVEYDQPLDAAGLIVLLWTTGTVTSSALSGWFQARLGVGRLLAISAAATGAALVIYTIAPTWPTLLAASVMLGAAAGATDPTVNGYVALHYNARLMQWLHASWGVGVTLGPMIMTASLVLADSWRGGYLVIGAFQFVLVFLFALTARSWEPPGESAPGEPDTARQPPSDRAGLIETLLTPRVWPGLALFLLYTGMELGVGLWSFSWLTAARGWSVPAAGLLVSMYWGMFTVGRVIAGFAAVRWPPLTLTRAGAVVALAGTGLLTVDGNPALSAVAIGLIGVGFAPLYPAMMSTTAARTGPRQFQHAMGLQVSAACLGVALVPGAIGLLSDAFSLDVVPLCLLALCAGFVLLHELTTLLGPHPEHEAGAAETTPADAS